MSRQQQQEFFRQAKGKLPKYPPCPTCSQTNHPHNKYNRRIYTTEEVALQNINESRCFQFASTMPTLHRHLDPSLHTVDKIRSQRLTSIIFTVLATICFWKITGKQWRTPPTYRWSTLIHHTLQWWAEGANKVQLQRITAGVLIDNLTAIPRMQPDLSRTPRKEISAIRTENLQPKVERAIAIPIKKDRVTTGWPTFRIQYQDRHKVDRVIDNLHEIKLTTPTTSFCLPTPQDILQFPAFCPLIK